MKSLAIVLALCLVVSAWADLYVEITVDGDVPDGLVDYGIIFMNPYDLDVFVWGTGTDTGLHHALFDIAATDGFWGLDQLGTVNPGGQFAGPNSAGTLDGAITGVELTSLAGVALPQTPATALLIYDNFVGWAGSAFAMLDIVPTDFVTNGGAPVVHTIGVRETPEPVSALLLAVAALGLRRR